MLNCFIIRLIDSSYLITEILLSGFNPILKMEYPTAINCISDELNWLWMIILCLKSTKSLSKCPFIDSTSKWKYKMNPSQGVYNPRAFELFWKPFVHFFQVLCVSHYAVFNRTHHIYRLVYFIAFSTLHVSLMFYTLLNGLHIQIRPSSQHKESPLMFYVNFVTVAGNLVSHTIAHFEPLFNRKEEEEIYRRLNEINEIFALKLNYVTNFDVIRRKFIRRTAVFYVLSATVSFGYSFYSLPTDGSSILLFLLNRAFAVVIVRARRCQVTFVVNALSNILRDLQILLERQQKNYRPHTTNSTSCSSEKIQYLRDIYSNVWLIKNLLSSCFGWTMIAFLMEFSFDLINSSYWAYINIKLDESGSNIIRKCRPSKNFVLSIWFVLLFCVFPF